jgi:hypothetical protein
MLKVGLFLKEKFFSVNFLDASFEEDEANFDLAKNKQVKSPKRISRTKRLTKRAPKKQQQNKKSSKSVSAKKKPKKSV